jgi:hypothetical protein
VMSSVARNPIKDLAATARYSTLDRPTSQRTKTTAEQDRLACAFGRITCFGRACLRFCAFCGRRQSPSVNDIARLLAGMQPSPDSPVLAMTRDRASQQHANRLNAIFATQTGGATR